ncbi:MAG: division plane positioning ATPase MipZ [Pseudomonadota bacterium]
MLDLKEGGPVTMTMSHIAARQELREMIRSLSLPGVSQV